MSMEFAPGSRPPGPDCVDRAAWGAPSVIIPQYIAKILVENEDTYPKQDACTPYYYSAAKIDDFIITSSLTGDCYLDIEGTGKFGGSVTAPTFIGNLQGTASGNKSFDIPHVTQPGKRIRHVCAEGPESGIYVRGRLTGKNTIELPDYWEGLVDPDSITVTLTQIGSSQDLIVESIDLGKVVKIKSGNASNIDCFYEVWVARYINPDNHDEKLHVVYDGESPADYPGNNDNFIVGGFQ